eukprot:2592327-Pleurochrysis_carterae.AAC.2
MFCSFWVKWIPSHVGIVPNIIVDSITSGGHEEPSDGMITGLLSKQVKSRPIIYGRRVQGRVEMADGPTYWEGLGSGGENSLEVYTNPLRVEINVKGRWLSG